MPLYEIDDAGELLPFRRLSGSSELYENEVEELLWQNLEECFGEQLFPIARQATIGGKGRPDILVLDKAGRVVVIEVKRDVSREQLSQALEYAGWARQANLDQLAGIYTDGPDRFFEDWQTFTESRTPQVVNPRARLILAAREFHGRTASALDFLRDYDVPVELVPITIYEDEKGRRLVDLETDRELELVQTPAAERRSKWQATIDGRRVRVSDLLEARLLQVGDTLVWRRRNLGQEFRATVTDKGAIRLADGREFAAPSRAASEAAGGGYLDGWRCWWVERLGDTHTLDQLRLALLDEEDGGDLADAFPGDPTN